MTRAGLRLAVEGWAACVLLGLSVCTPAAFSQRTGNPLATTTPGALPLVNVGGGPMESQFESMDFAQKILAQQNKKTDPKTQAREKELVDSGTVSELDLAAPARAVNEFNTASSLLRGQHSQEAIGHLQKAIAAYPKFVSAHNYLGMAYVDMDDPGRAQTEFETAANLDAKFAASFLNLGRLALSQNNYPLAGSQLQKAAAIRPADPAILTALAYAQQGNHQYRDAIDTVGRVHALQHPGMGNAHYVAAAAAVALNDLPVAQSELTLFLQEDPSNPLAPTARHNLDILNRSQQKAGASSSQQTIVAAAAPPPNLANSDRLKAQLAGAGDEAGGAGGCEGCAGPSAVAEASSGLPSVPDPADMPPDQWTIRKVVDEVAVFFGVSSGGHSVTDLTLGDIKVRDDSKPPEKVLQFVPQSKLSLRLGVLIDTSGSVQQRFSFEKQAAAKFMQQMLSNSSDLGFVAGFAETSTVTQDFTGDHDQLAAGVNKLPSGGGTALFDAVSRACWKLEAYPEHERVAKVLVVLTDGEDNSSHASLRQTIRDEEATGVTVYTISTKEGNGDKTEADKVLQTLAERGGGEAMFPGDIMTLGKSFDKLRDQIRSRYLIAYKPADFEPNGKYRTISIVAEKDGKHLQVHARKGYHARVEAATP
ncbi:MAG: VWA domain-containing protein [Candidatus Korobacteraceae bacterium]